jgi:hypothetical protein
VKIRNLSTLLATTRERAESDVHLTQLTSKYCMTARTKTNECTRRNRLTCRGYKTTTRWNACKAVVDLVCIQSLQYFSWIIIRWIISICTGCPPKN